MLDSLRLKDKIFLAIMALGLVFVLVQKVIPKDDEEKSREQTVTVTFNEKDSVRALVAADPQSMFRGLSGVEQLEDDQGMLFVHEQSGKHAYVMRGMLFDLDFIFILDDRVVDVAKNVAREYGGKIAGETDYNRVLEVKAGWVGRREINLGDKVEISGLDK